MFVDFGSCLIDAETANGLRMNSDMLIADYSVLTDRYVMEAILKPRGLDVQGSKSDVVPCPVARTFQNR